MNTKKRILLTGITAFFSQVTSILVALFLPKLLIQSFGSELNGVISAARQFSTYLAMIDSGIAAATCYQFITAFKTNNNELIKDLYTTVGVFFRKVSYIVVFATIILSLCYGLILKSSTDIFLIVYIFFMYSFGTIIAFWGFFKYNLVLFSDGDQYKITYACILSSLLVFVLQYTFIKLSINIYLVIAVFPISIILRLFLIKYMTLKKHPFIHEKGHVVNSLISQKWNSITLNIADSMKTFAPIISMSYFFGASYVSIYAIYESILHLGSSILIMCQNGLTPLLGKFFIEKNESAKEKFELLYTIIFIISAIIVTCFSSLFIGFIRIYLGTKTDVSYIYPLLATLMVINIWFLMIRTSYESLIKANGKIKELRNGAIIEICIAMLFSTLFAKMYGFESIILGVIFSSAYRTIRMALYCWKKMDFGKKIIPSLVFWMFITGFAVLSTQHLYSKMSIPQFIVLSAITCSICTIVFSLIGLIQSPALRKILKKKSFS